MSVNSIKKRTDKIQKDLSEYKEYGGITKENLPAPIKKTNQQNSEHNKPMTVEEKNQLGNNIRTLNKEQLKGIIKILNENNSVPKSKYFEFDIDKLPNKKLRELERYVKECLIVNNRNLSSLSANPKNLNQKKIKIIKILRIIKQIVIKLIIKILHRKIITKKLIKPMKQGKNLLV